MKKTAIGILILVLVLGALLMSFLFKENGTMNSPKTLRVLSHEQLLTRVNHKDEPMRLRTATDVLPGGYAAAMIPLMIDWVASDISSEKGFVIIHNLNHGGNPVDGTTVLCSAKVPLDGVESVEFTLLPLDNIGKKGLVQHGQLRFAFRADNPVLLLNYGDESMGSDRNVQDLVFSWEAWRAPDIGFDVKTGMDPESYLLSPRVFSGPTRFLDDSLGQRDWFSYPLRLPNGRQGLAELLRTNLALCDGVARHTVSKILKQSEKQWLEQAPGGGVPDEEAIARWRTLLDVVAPHSVTDDSLINLEEKDLAYQTLLRSCATMALYTINVAVDRLVADGHTDGLNADHRMLPELGKQEPWMTELAETDLKGIFLRAPAILRYLRANPQAFPKNIPNQLEKAGLLEMDSGKPKLLHYELDGTTPYGTLKANLIK
jgi:hypothetical protein